MTVRRRKITSYAWSCTCERCGHSWESTGKEPPRACAKCKALNWNRAPRTYQRKPKA